MNMNFNQQRPPRKIRPQGFMNGILALALLVVILLVLFYFLGPASPLWQRNSVYYDGSPTPSASASSDNSSQAGPSASPTTNVGNYQGKYTIANVHVKAGYRDVTGKPAIIVAYDLTFNGSDKGDPGDIELKAYQNGKELDDMPLDGKIPGYNEDSKDADIAPGKTVHVTEGFTLINGKDPVRITAQHDFTDETLMFDKTFRFKS